MRLVYADHHISPFETALTKFFVCTDHHISPFETALTKFFVCTDRHISPFEGGRGDVHSITNKPFVRKKNLVKTFYIQKKVSIFVEKLSN